jgi:hypothetical protein
MKPYTRILILSVTLLSSTFNTIHSQTIKEQLTGAWFFDYQASLAEVDTATKTKHRA